MATSFIGSAFVAYASYHPKAPANHADWDTLYVAVTLLGIVLIVALLASLSNVIDDRRH